MELPNILMFACLHFNSGQAILYKGVALRVTDIFFRNVEILLIKNCVKEVTEGKKSAVSVSMTYRNSFADFPAWESGHDLLLLRSVSTHGFGKWRNVLDGLIPGRDIYDIYRMVNAAEASLDVAVNSERMERFAEQRTRFLVYCLMEDEYEGYVA